MRRVVIAYFSELAGRDSSGFFEALDEIACVRYSDLGSQLGYRELGLFYQ